MLACRLGCLADCHHGTLTRTEVNDLSWWMTRHVRQPFADPQDRVPVGPDGRVREEYEYLAVLGYLHSLAKMKLEAGR